MEKIRTKKKNMDTIRRVVDMVKPYKKTIIIISIIALLIDILELIRPYLIKVAIDDYLSIGVATKGMITIGMIGISYIIIVIISNLLDFFARMSTITLGEKVIYDVRNKLFSFVQKANITFHDKTSTGKIFVRITNDAEDISSLFKDVLTTFVKDIVMIVGIVCMMVYMSVQLSLLSFIVFPFVIITTYFITKALNKAYTNSKNIRTKINVFLSESIYGIRLIKVFNREKEKLRECKKHSLNYYNSRKATPIFEGLLPATIDIFKNIGISIIVYVSVNTAFSVKLDVGLIYMLITYIGNLFEPVTRIIENIEIVEESVVSINKIYDILDKKEQLEDFEEGRYITDLKGKIEFKNVWFAYEKDKYILKDVSFTIEPHQSIALVGKTGSGKTTITNLINRFYDVQKGQILIDGIDIKNINKRSLRRNVGTILQDPFIFARSIKDNIKLYSNLSDESVKKVLKLSSSDKFVSKLPNKENEIAIERGESFSIGQKQLLSFARIFAHNPSIFILDEATANIDTTTEKQIQKSIDVISKDKTSIFIAHRLSTVVNVDKIIVLDKGKIVEEGSHKELMKKDGYYSNLYNSYYTSLG